MRKTDSSSEKLKYYNHYIKSAQGTLGLALIVNLIYVLRVMLAKDLNFWFSLYTTQFFIKSSAFAPSLGGSQPKIWAELLVAVSVFALVPLAVLQMKNTKWFYFSLVIYSLDTVFMVWGFATNYFGDFAQSSIIDVIMHVFVLVFLVLGIYAGEKRKKITGSTKL